MGEVPDKVKARGESVAGPGTSQGSSPNFLTRMWNKFSGLVWWQKAAAVAVPVAVAGAILVRTPFTDLADSIQDTGFNFDIGDCCLGVAGVACAALYYRRARRR